MISQQSLGLWGSIGSVLSFSVVALVDPIREAFSIQISPIQYLICLAVFILGLVFGYLLFSKSYKPSIRGLRNTNEDLKRYSIVVVDDIFNRTSTKEFFNDRLSNFNVTFMSKVESARQLTGFDIIVLDIIGVSRYVGGGSAIMKELYQMCPQKYVLAISINILSV